MCFSLFCTNPNQSPSTKVFYIYFCPYSNQSFTMKGVIYFALTLTKALSQRVFFHYVYPYSNQRPTKKDVFLYFCLYLYQSRTKEGVFFSLFCPYSNKSPIKKDVFLYFGTNPYQSHATKGFFLIVAFIPTKALPQRVFYSFLSLF